MSAMALRELDNDLWVSEQSLRFGGVEIGARMTVVRLPGGKLVVHSPVKPTEELFESVEALGSVQAVVAPNRFHHLFAGDWAARYPDALLLAGPGLAKKRKDLKFHGELPASASAEWGDDLLCEAFGGMPMMNEVVFFHRPSRTLIVSDLAFCVGDEAEPLTRFLFKVGGHYGEVGPTVLERLLVRDRKAASASMRRILEWDFERVVVAHGVVSESGGKEQLRRGYTWLLAD